ncbi:MAG: radical SAM protein [Candidatus Omnitrophota bacterium]
MSIKHQEYREFSNRIRSLRNRKPSACQIELTYLCPLHCRHCYAGCYNKKTSAKKQLSTEQVKEILRKCKKAGIVWLGFTGGDPLLRQDFAQIYSYALELGFITTIFSSLATLNKETLEVLKKSPPFVVETTLNAADAIKYKEVTATNLFNRHLRNIKKLIKFNIGIKVKTQITKQNIHDTGKIKELIESMGLEFRPSTLLHAQLNHNTSPCVLRVAPKDSLIIMGKHGQFSEKTNHHLEAKINIKDKINGPKDSRLFTCGAGNDSFWVDTEGKMIICGNLRTFTYDLLKRGNSVEKGFFRLSKKVHELRFKTNSKCRACYYRSNCQWCPARAYLETGSFEKPNEYFCDLAYETLKSENPHFFQRRSLI